MMKRALCLLLSLFMLFSVSIAVSASYDDDISGQWDADPAPLSGLSVERDAAFFTVYNADNKTAGITAVIACYDENGRIISVKSSREAALSVNSLSLPVPEGTAYVKSFALDDDGCILTPDKIWRPSFKMLAFGDGAIISHSPLDIFYSLSRGAGTELDVFSHTYDNIGTSSAYTTLTTYNIYEMFRFDGTSASAKIKTPVSENTISKFSYFYSLLSREQDCLLIASSRDRVIGNPDSAGRAVTAFDEIQKTFYAANPNGKIVIFVPMPYDPPNESLINKFGFPADTDTQKHNELIKAHASALAAKATGDCTLAQIGDAFAFFKDNYGDAGIDLYDEGGVFESMAGAYYTACVLYGYVYGASPVGIGEYGALDESTALLLQKAAHRFVFGTSPESVTPEKAPLSHKPYKECDPRTMSYRDPRFVNETYPEYFDEFFATAYAYEAFGGAALQYDQNNLASASGSPRRLTLGVDPKTLTPQRMTFLDCTWFCHSVYKAAFDYIIKESVNTGVINIKKGEVYRRTAAQIAADPEAAKADFIKTLRPCDLIMEHNRETNAAHGMLYIGNGMLIHCSGYSHKAGGGQDYSKALKKDVRELLGGVAFTKIDYLITEGVDSHYAFNGERELLILRPLGVEGTVPTQDATTRAKNLKGVICWKESTAYAGASVNPGCDVTFTYCIRNDNDTKRDISIKDVLPENTIFKSGDVTFDKNALDTVVTVRGGELKKLSFTVTVDPGASYGYIPCDKTEIGGITLQDTPIYVAKTLTRDEQSAISSSAAEAATDGELVTAIYAGIGKTVALGTDSELINSVCLVAADGKSFDVGNGFGRDMLADNLFGGRYYGGDFGGNRIKEVTLRNFTVGDVLCVMSDASSVQLYVYAGEGVFKTVKNGVTVSLLPASSATLCDSLLGEFGFFVLRPSISF